MPELPLRSPVYLNQKVDHHKTNLNLADSELECKERKKSFIMVNGSGDSEGHTSYKKFGL